MRDPAHKSAPSRGARRRVLRFGTQPRLRRVPPLVGLCIACATSSALAGNDEGILLGNEAAMTGGAVTATSSSGAAMWYNPAALVNYDQKRLDFGGTGFQMRIYDSGGPIAFSDGEQAEQIIQDRAFVPNAIAFSLPIGNSKMPQRFGFGVFATHYETSLVQSSLETTTDTNQTTQVAIWSQTRSRLHHIPFTYAIELHPTIAVGATGQVVIRQLRNSFDFNLRQMSPEGDVITSYEQDTAAINDVGIGVRGSLGVQWRPIPELSLGASLLSPSRIFMTITSATASSARLEGSELVGDTETTSGTEWGFERFQHMRLRMAAAYRFDRGWVAAEMDYSAGHDNDFLGQTTGSVANYRLGGMFHLNPSLTLGAGVFSDREATSGPYLPGEYRIDYYGGTLGATYVNSKLAGGRFTYSITLAPRYAYGSGTQGVIVIDPGPPAQTTGIQPLPAVIHEIGVHLGLALSWEQKPD